MKWINENTCPRGRKPWNDTTERFLPHFGVCDKNRMHYAAYCRKFRHMAQTQLKKREGSFKAGGMHRLRKMKIPPGSGTMHATSILQYMDHINSKVKELNRKETAFMDQVWQKFQESEPPKELTLDKCTPLERTLFMRRFRTAHIDFWAKEHSRYPDTTLPGVPEAKPKPAAPKENSQRRSARKRTRKRRNKFSNPPHCGHKLNGWVLTR